jgi:hypothetical protein
MKEVLNQFIREGVHDSFNGIRDWPNFFLMFEKKLSMLTTNFDLCEKAGE